MITDATHISKVRTKSYLTFTNLFLKQNWWSTLEVEIYLCMYTCMSFLGNHLIQVYFHINIHMQFSYFQFCSRQRKLLCSYQLTWLCCIAMNLAVNPDWHCTNDAMDCKWEEEKACQIHWLTSFDVTWSRVCCGWGLSTSFW